MNLIRHTRAGFTLIELLLVVAIVVVMLAVVTPDFAGGLGGTRLQMAGQGVMHLSRYARSMAVLQQVPVELTFTSDGILRVAAQGSQRQAQAEIDWEKGAAESLSPLPTGDETESATNAPASSAATTGGSMTQMETEQKYEHVSFSFLGYADDADTQKKRKLHTKHPENEEETEETSFSVRYKSNGTCRPYRVRVTDKHESSLVVAVDMLGMGKVEEE